MNDINTIPEASSSVSEDRAIKELEDKPLEKEGRTEVFMKKVAEADIPELSVSVEEGDDYKDNSVALGEEDIGKEIPPVELPAIDVAGDESQNNPR